MLIPKRTRVIFTIIVTIWGLITVVPFVWMILSAFKKSNEIIKSGGNLWPQNPTFDNFIMLFDRLNFGMYLKNTLIITMIGMLAVLLNAMAGYGFGRFNFKGKNWMFLMVLATMMIPGQVTMIPVYLMLNSVNLTNSYAGIVLPGLAGAFGVFLFRQFFSNMSNDVFEAAKLDGASEAYAFIRIGLPLAGPVLAVQLILTFIGGWNAFLWPLIVANEEKFYTLSVGLNLLQGQHGTDYGLQMAGSTFMVVPVLILFVILQKYILQGFDISGEK